MKWVVDSEQTVHVNICGAKVGAVLPYFPQRIVRNDASKPSLVTVPTVELMVEHLARPDSSGGMVTHQGPCMLKPCAECIPS